MSTLKVTNIAGLTGSSTNVIEGLAKMWCNFNGIGTVSIRDSNNTSSITDNGTGYYTFNYTNNMSSTGYCIDSQSCGTGASYPSVAASSGNTRPNTATSSPYKSQPTTSAHSITCALDGNLAAPFDTEWTYGNILGDLA